jgi:hypothetical protein
MGPDSFLFRLRAAGLVAIGRARPRFSFTVTTARLRARAQPVEPRTPGDRRERRGNGGAGRAPRSRQRRRLDRIPASACGLVGLKPSGAASLGRTSARLGGMLAEGVVALGARHGPCLDACAGAMPSDPARAGAGAAFAERSPAIGPPPRQALPRSRALQRGHAGAAPGGRRAAPRSSATPSSRPHPRLEEPGVSDLFATLVTPSRAPPRLSRSSAGRSRRGPPSLHRGARRAGRGVRAPPIRARSALAAGRGAQRFWSEGCLLTPTLAAPPRLGVPARRAPAALVERVRLSSPSSPGTPRARRRSAASTPGAPGYVGVRLVAPLLRTCCCVAAQLGAQRLWSGCGLALEPISRRISAFSAAAKAPSSPGRRRARAP